ncbi:MAG: hypothetical protein WBP13_05745 [Methylophilaceae bacterium]
MAQTAGMRSWPIVVAVIILYAILANYTIQSSQHHTLGIFVAISPIVLVSALLAWKSLNLLLMLGLATVFGISLWLLWPLLIHHYEWIYWLQHESLQFVLFLTFAQTLLANRQPLCTQLAMMVHGSLTPAHARYTGKVTVAWTLFFALMIMISTWLFFTYPISVWSVFANFIFLPLVVLMFIVEFIIRKWALPEAAGAHIMDAVQIYLKNSKR